MTPGLQRHYTLLRPRNISVLLSALSRLGARDAGLVGDLLHVSLPLLPSFEGTELASALHALPGLRARPSREWVAAFFAASGPRLHEFGAWGLCSCAWALGALRKRPPEEWLADFCGAAEAAFGGMTGQGLANLAWGLAAARARPPGVWVRRLVRVARDAMGQLSPQGAANFTWCVAGAGTLRRPRRVRVGPTFPPRPCGSLRAPPPARGRPTQRLPHIPSLTRPRRSSRALPLPPRALAKLSFRPEAAFVSALLAHTQRLLPSYRPLELSCQLYSFAVLGLRPGRAWMDAFYAASLPLLESGFGSQALSNTLWALARIEAVRPGRAMAARLARGKVSTAGQRARPAGRRHPGRCLQLCSLNVLRRRRSRPPPSASRPPRPPQLPPREWLATFLLATLAKLPTFSPQALANTLWALARMRATPRAAWLDAVIERSFALLPLFGTSELTATLAALQGLDYAPPQRWFNRWVGCERRPPASAPVAAWMTPRSQGRGGGRRRFCPMRSRGGARRSIGGTR
jgi:hypothetical protein